jgi:UDP:flavonoid glycosyltransferase YjiC (YdhE family)
MGKRILMTTTGSLGDLHPFIAIGLGLKSRGHAVTIATSNLFQAKVQQTGLKFAPMGPHIGPDASDLMGQIINLRKGPETLIRQVLYPSIRSVYAEVLEAAHGAELIVTHPITFAAQIAAEKLGLPWVSTVTAPLSFFSVHDPSVIPFLPDLRQLGAAGIILYQFLLKAGRIQTHLWSGPVRRFRKSVGLPAGRDPVFEGQHSPQRVLALFSSVMAEAQPDWPPYSSTTGFPFYDLAEHGKGMDPELERFLDSGPAPVVFTLGSSAVHQPGTFFHECLIAIRRLECRAVLLAGGMEFPEGLPLGTLAVPYAPYSSLFPRAAAIVHSGGIGTCGQTLAAGRPMLIVPFAFDQPDNASRLMRLGVARSIARAKYTGKRAASELEELLNDPSYGTHGEELACNVRAEDGVRAACDGIEEVARSG